jgi:hypothetical protein
MKRGVSVLILSICVVTVCAAFLEAQSQPQGRISFYAQSSMSNQTGGQSFNSSELVSMFTLLSPYRQDGSGLEYNVDLRFADYPSSEGSYRFSIYNAYVGQQFGNGLLARGGQMWINEMGALGSVGGGLVQYRRLNSLGGQVRFGGFAGLEPQILQAGYTPGIMKFGGYVSFDGKNGRSNSFGYVTIRDSGLTERSVFVFNNFIPVGDKFTLYQAGEYDLVGPAGMNTGSGLNYFFVNGRLTPNRTFELQGTYHHGLSLDTRTITTDELNGRPVNPALLQGYLFESVEGRATVTVARNIRVFAGYGRDRNNQQDLPIGRLNAGVFSGSLFGTGWDFRASMSRWTGATPHNSLSFSAGHNIGRRVYISGDYTSSLSVFKFTGADGVVVENRPNYKLFSVSSNMNLSRTLSLLFTFDHTMGDTYSENRVLAGVTFRFL